MWSVLYQVETGKVYNLDVRQRCLTMSDKSRQGRKFSFKRYVIQAGFCDRIIGT